MHFFKYLQKVYCVLGVQTIHLQLLELGLWLPCCGCNCGLDKVFALQQQSVHLVLQREKRISIK